MKSDRVPMTDGRRFVRDLALLVGLPLVVSIWMAVWMVPWGALSELFMVVPYAASNGDVFGTAAGRWDWVREGVLCEEDSHEIRFSHDRRRMTITHANPVGDSSGVEKREWEYDIVEWDSTRIRGTIRGESRRTDAGAPVVWDLVLTGPDTYRWHRTDWEEFAYTGEVRRCPEASDLPPTILGPE